MLKNENSSKGKENNEIPLERFKLYIGLAKFIASLFFGTVLTGVLAFIINWREVEIKARESDLKIRIDERQELANYFRYTMEGDVYDRLKLSAFFGDVLTNEQGSNSWKQYYQSQKKLLDDFLAKRLEIRNINNPKISEIDSEIAILSELSDTEFTAIFEHATLKALLNPVKVEISQMSPGRKPAEATLLDIVNKYKIQIFYNKNKSQQKTEANDIKKALQNVGVTTTIEVRPQLDRASSDQIRYFAETEREAAYALQNILQLSYRKRSFKLQAVYTPSPGSISIFLES